MLLFLKYNSSSESVTDEVGMFSIVFLISFFLEKYIFVVYSFSLLFKYFSGSPIFA